MSGPTSTGLVLLDEIRRGAAYTARLAPARLGVATLASATVRLIQPDGAVAWTGTATVAAAAGSVVIPGSVTTDVDPATGWLLEWSYTLTDGSTDAALNPVDVVLYTLHPVAAWSDVVARHKDLTRLVGSDLSDAQAKGDHAWFHIIQKLRGRGKRPCLVVDSGMFFELHILKWLALVYGDLDTGGEASSEGERHLRYDAAFEAMWNTTTFELADPSTWRRTGDRTAARSTLWLGGTGSGSFRPIPTQ